MCSSDAIAFRSRSPFTASTSRHRSDVSVTAPESTARSESRKGTSSLGMNPRSSAMRCRSASASSSAFLRAASASSSALRRASSTRCFASAALPSSSSRVPLSRLAVARSSHGVNSNSAHLDGEDGAERQQRLVFAEHGRHDLTAGDAERANVLSRAYLQLARLLRCPSRSKTDRSGKSLMFPRSVIAAPSRWPYRRHEASSS